MLTNLCSGLISKILLEAYQKYVEHYKTVTVPVTENLKCKTNLLNRLLQWNSYDLISVDSNHTWWSRWCGLHQRKDGFSTHTAALNINTLEAQYSTGAAMLMQYDATANILLKCRPEV